MEPFFDSKSMFDSLWDEWLYIQVRRLSADTPMVEMAYEDILKSLPKEKQNEFSEKRLYFAQRTGIGGIAEERKDTER